MRKRLIAQGPKERNSYTLTLPKEWVINNKLQKSRTIFLELVGDNIIIKPESGGSDVLTVDGNDFDDTLPKILQGAYRAGIDEITFIPSSSDQIRKVADIIEQMTIGYEILEQGKDKLIIKDITTTNQEEFHRVMRRVWLLLISMVEEEEGKAITFRQLKKLVNYCQRILIQHGHVEYRKTPLYYLILDRIEKVGDEIKWLESKQRETKEWEAVSKGLRDAYELFYTFNPEQYEQAAYTSYRLKNGLREMKIDIHLHNLARLTNSLYGDISTLSVET